MKKLIISAIIALASLGCANGQNVITNDYGSPITGADGPSINESSNDESEPISCLGLMYYSFDGFENYGIFGSYTPTNGVGIDLAERAQFKSHGNLNTDFLINYSFGLWAQNSNQLLLILAAGPSIRVYDKIEGFDKYGNAKYDYTNIAFDGVINPRLTVKFGNFVLTGGYFYWAPKFKFSKDDGATGGFNIGLGYSF